MHIRYRLNITKIDLYLRWPLYTLLLMVFLDATVFAIRYMYSLMVISLAGIIIILSMIFNNKSVERIKRRQFFEDKTDVMILLMIIMVFMNNWDIRNKNYKYEILFLVLFFLYKEREQYADIYISVLRKFIFFFCGMATFLTLFFYFFPTLYYEKILSLCPKAYYAGLLYCFEHGYQAGISLHYSTNAIFILMFVTCLYIELLEKRKRKREFFFLFIVSIYALLLTAKRAHIIIVLLCMFIMYFINTGKNKKKFLRMYGTVLFILLLFILLMRCLPQLNMLWNRFLQIMHDDASISERFILYKYALELFKEAPIIGNGWGSYKYMAALNLGNYNATHNVFLQLLCEVGIVGFVVFVLFFFTVIKQTILSYKKKIQLGNYDIQRYYLAMAVFVQSFFIVYCFTGNPLYDNQTCIIYMLCSSYGIIHNC